MNVHIASSGTHLTELHRRVERLATLTGTGTDRQDVDVINCLIHEIAFRQTELERQNDELSKGRDAIETDRRKYERLYRNYSSLFNLAPIGYLVIDRDGVIHDINLSASISLDSPRSELTGRRITDFIHRDDQDCFYYQKLNCQNNKENIIFELKMKKSGNLFFDARLQMQPFSSPHDHEQRYSITLVDTSEFVHVSSGFALQQKCLELVCHCTTVEELIEAYVQLVKAYLQCDAVGIRTHDDAGNVSCRADDGFSQALCEAENPSPSCTDPCMCALVMNGRTDPSRPFFTEKGSFYTNSVSRFLAVVSPEDQGFARHVCHAHGYESVALIPIGIGGAIEGLIHVADRRENCFPLRLIENLENAGSRLGLAVQRFHLQDRLRESVDTLNDLSRHLLKVQEDEQRRIAMELHDGCGQDLNVLKLRLTNLQHRLPAGAADLIQACEGLCTYADKIIDDLRNIAHGLKPSALETLGLAAATRQMIREFSTYAKVQVEADVDVLDGIEDPMTQTCLFRIFQEALTNVHKHAQATWVGLAASRKGDSMRIRIEDNGIGFDAQKQYYRANGQMGMGMSALALRCRMIGADLSLDSQAGKGTRWEIRLPGATRKSSR